MSHSKKALTLSDIAIATGVSKATVSLALRGSPKISESTRKKVSEAASELGYEPNPLIDAQMAFLRTRLKKTSVDTIAYITRYERKANALNELYLEGARERAVSFGFQLDVFSTSDLQLGDRRLDSILTNRGIVGVIISALPEATGELSINWKNYACSTIGFTLRAPSLHRACPDSFSNMMELLKTLEARGYNRIGMVSDHFSDERGYHQAHAAFQIHQYERGIEKADNRFLSLGSLDENQILAWYKKVRPDVIVSLHADAIAKYLANANISVPDQVGVATYLAMPSSPEISGFSQAPKTIGENAIDLVIAQLHRNERGLPKKPKRVLTRGYWIEGKTLLKPLNPEPETQEDGLAQPL